MAIFDLVAESLNDLIDEVLDNYPIKTILKDENFLIYIGNNICYLNNLEKEEPTKKELIEMGSEFVLTNFWINYKFTD